MKSIQKLLIPNLSAGDAVACLVVLREAFSKERAVAFFRTSNSVGDQFLPKLSILGIHPAQVFQSRSGRVSIARDGAVKEITGNSFEVFANLLKDRETSAQTDLPFFQGGALGYFGYDAVRMVEPSLQKTKNLSLRSEVYDAEFVFFKNYLIFDHAKNSVTLLSEDPAAERSFAIQLKTVCEKIKALSLTPPKEDQLKKEVEALPLSSFQSSFGKEKFLSGVAKLKEHILEGDIFQAVLSEKFRIRYQEDSITLFQALLLVNPAPYHFFFEIDGRSYLGASPEMLLKADQDRLETHPIAGTRARGKTAAEELKNEQQLISCPKETSEHLMLVDLARNDLGRVSTAGSVEVKSFQKLRKFGGVMHLVSKVTGLKKKDLSTLSAFSSAFPAGTLSGAPKIRAMSLLSDLEPEPRGFYGGAFVAASFTGDLDSCISIRCMSVVDQVVTIQAGAGIVADSVAENEYLEIEHKTRLARKALALAILAKCPGRAG